MRSRTLRTIGATLILVGVAVAAMTQIESNRDREPVELLTAEPTTTLGALGASDTTASSTSAEPFVYRVGVLAGLTTDNFWAFYGEQPSVWNSYILGPTKPALFTADPDTGSLQPELAAEAVAPTFDEEGWRVRVDLATDLRWSDGEPVTADDLVFTFETVRALGLGGSWADAFPAEIESMHAEGDRHVRIEFSVRPRLAVWPHGVGLAPIMAEHVWKDHGASSPTALFAQSGAGDVGGGPLAIASVSESTVISRANEGYPLAAPPEIVEYRVFPDETEAVAALRRGDVDSVLTPKGLTARHVAQVDSDPGVSVIDNPGNGVRYLGFNLDRYPMADQQFRTALALLVERGALADAISPGGAPAWSLVPEANIKWFDPSAAAENQGLFEGTLAVRLATAMKGLSAAGYRWEKAPSVGPDGKLSPGSGLTIDGLTPQPLTILTPGDAYDPARPRYVEEIAGTLKALGFDARPVETDFDTVVDLAFTPGDDGALHYDMYLLGWTLGNPALPGYYGALFAKDGAMNNTGYASTEFAEALDSYESAYTLEDAFDALWEMERTLAADLPYLLLYRDQITEAYRSDRVDFDLDQSLGGLQARLGGIREVQPRG